MATAEEATMPRAKNYCANETQPGVYKDAGKQTKTRQVLTKRNLRGNEFTPLSLNLILEVLRRVTDLDFLELLRNEFDNVSVSFSPFRVNSLSIHTVGFLLVPEGRGNGNAPRGRRPHMTFTRPREYVVEIERESYAWGSWSMREPASYPVGIKLVLYPLLHHRTDSLTPCRGSSWQSGSTTRNDG